MEDKDTRYGTRILSKKTINEGFCSAKRPERVKCRERGRVQAYIGSKIAHPTLSTFITSENLF
jgi:hypothetical protein